MELTLDQALQQAVAAHKEGKLQDAERLYRAILQTQPNHPDANHNLGVLAVAVGKPLEALPFFKQALDANSEVEQFWLSYIDVLIKVGRFRDAKQVLVDAQQSGVPAEKLDSSREQLWKNVPTAMNPSRDEIERVLKYFQSGTLNKAETLSSALTQQFPDHSFGWKILGAVLHRTGRFNDALIPMQRSIELNPQDAQAHNNLGLALRNLGQLNAAEIHLRQAIELKPDYAEFHNNLGITLSDLGKFNHAEDSFRHAISLNPNYAAARNNIGMLLNTLGRADSAVACYLEAIALQPDYPAAYENLCDAVKAVRFSAERPELYPIFTQILTNSNFTRPQDVAPSILSLLRQDPLIRNLPLEHRAPISLSELTRIIENLNQVPLLHHLMRLCPLPDLQFERLFLNMRRSLLANLENLEASPNLLYFLSTLSLHCFVNEYVYAETGDEACLVAELENRLKYSAQPQATEILCLALYRPLYQYPWSQRVRALHSIEDVRQRLIEEPLTELKLAKNIPALGEISDEVSNAVRKQYEENPYPRWVKTKIPAQSKSISQICTDMKLCLRSEGITNTTAPTILVAGCGTGQQSVGTATLFSDCHVTAVDLSLASLAYAQRKANDLKLRNLEYFQADILRLGKIEGEFDIVESTGVLHHLHEPMIGWRVLTTLLKPGGLMKIGLYSELARRHIAEIREKTASLRSEASQADIRKFRQSVAESDDKNHQLLTTSSDFFSLSTFRDLIFHVQEHRFTLPQIKKSLGQLGLEFCGFENQQVVGRFKEHHGDGSDTSDLMLWHEFEQSHPRAFAGMYQFWCQKI